MADLTVGEAFVTGFLTGAVIVLLFVGVGVWWIVNHDWGK